MFGILAFSFSSIAAIVPNSVNITEASNQVRITDTQWRVYGSFLGPEPGSSINTTFDSCDEPPAIANAFVGCNKKRVTASTILKISFSDDTQFTGQSQVLAYLKDPNNLNPIPIDQVGDISVFQTTNYQSNITWGALCAAADGVMGDYTLASTVLGQPAEACLDGVGGQPLRRSIQIAVGLQSGTSNLASQEVVIDLRFFTTEPTIGLFDPDAYGGAQTGTDNFANVPLCAEFNGSTTGTSDTNGSTVYNGFCDYKLIPGDEKILIETNPTVVNNLFIYQPNNSATGDTFSVPFLGFVMYLSNLDFANTMPWLAAGEVRNDFNVAGNISSGFSKSNITSSVIKNEQPVFTRLASLDEAGNITHLFSDNAIAQNCIIPEPNNPALAGFYRYYVGSFVDTDPIPFTGRCPYATIPSLVTGLLSEDINCFVATALKDSPYDFQVLALREFRNRFLKSFAWGQTFINFYYEQGPKAALWLNENPSYKPAFRILLWPVYIIAAVFNKFGGFTGLVFLGVLLLLPFLLWRFRPKSVSLKKL